MSFKPTALYYTDGYKIGHKRMLAPGTQKLYGTWIPRSLKYAPTGVKKILSFGQQLVVRWLRDEFQENFFELPKDAALIFTKDMCMYLGLKYDGSHFEALHDLGYLPIRIKSLPEGIETNPNIPHMTFINTVDGFAWLTLYLETIISSIAWKPTTSATIALQYRRNLAQWVAKTDPANKWLIDYLAHDFSARGLSPWDMMTSGLGHATSFRGSDTLVVIPAARYFYDEPTNEVCISSVNASEHSVSTTCIFTMGESKMIDYYLDQFPEGILSIVSDTFDLWTLITKYLPENKAKIMARNGKLVIRPDSGDPVRIVCGYHDYEVTVEHGVDRSVLGYRVNETGKWISTDEKKGVIQLLWEIFGGTTTEAGYKLLDSHIGAIYGDSITLERQIQIYEKLAENGFATTNIVLGVGSFTYQCNTRDALGFAAKGAWFEINGVGYNIYKDPITDDGTKKSLKGFVAVSEEDGEYVVHTECTPEQEATGLLQTIFEDGKLYNQTTLTQIRKRVAELASK
jgi:nicotinamide phosphoribosyltransferase